MPEFIQPCFKRVSSISRHNPVRQTVPNIDHPIGKAKLSQIIYFTRDFSSLISFPLVTWTLDLYNVGATSGWYFPLTILYLACLL